VPAADDLNFTCPKCRATVQAQPSHAGQKVRCPRCGEGIKVPGVAPSQSSDDEDWFKLSPEPPPRPAWQGDEPVEESPHPKTRSKPSEVPRSAVKPEPTSLRSEDSGTARQPAKKPPGAAAKPTAPPTARGAKPNAAARMDDGDELINLDEEPGPIVQSVEEETQYRMRCHVCDATLIVHAAEAGRSIRCPDCGIQLVVPPPPKRKPKPDVMRSVGPDMRLAPAEARKELPDAPERKLASDALARAEAELRGEDVDRMIDHLYENPRVGEWLARAFGYLLEPGVLPRLFVGTGLALSCLLMVWLVYRFLPLPEVVLQCIAAAMVWVGWIGLGLSAPTRHPSGDGEMAEPVDSAAFAGTLALAALPGVIPLAFSGPSLSNLFLGLASVWLLWPLLLRWQLSKRGIEGGSEWLPKAYFATACLSFAGLLLGVFANMLPLAGQGGLLAGAWALVVFTSGIVITRLAMARTTNPVG